MIISVDFIFQGTSVQFRRIPRFYFRTRKIPTPKKSWKIRFCFKDLEVSFPSPEKPRKILFYSKVLAEFPWTSEILHGECTAGAYWLKLSNQSLKCFGNSPKQKNQGNASL